ncbi:MAG TPA: AAA family ATPase, partial [Porphyromonadaceae bacterium]|nr:AAA family ATPase [Porphyromonadaceae bacterium]
MDTSRRLPYGISNFARLIEDNYYYVDKTSYIESLEREANPYQFFIRPRKFGKSLFLSMLSWYYDINSANRFEELFGRFYIGSHPTPERNSYLVMAFNFSGVDTHDEETFRKSFANVVQQSAIGFLSKYRIIFANADELIRNINETQPGIAVLRIAYDAANDVGRKIFVIIDEYDHFANDLIAMGVDAIYKKQVRANGIVRDFYETLKIGTSDAVGRIFITGISPVMIDDLTSGFNIASNLTVEERYNEMLGFTQAEVEGIIKETGLNRKLAKVDIQNYYDGYKFHKDAPRRVYNPTMLLYYFNQLRMTGKEPENIIDDNLKT